MDHLVAGDRGDSERLLKRILGASSSESDDEPHHAYLYDDRRVVEKYMPDLVLDPKTTIPPLDVSSDLTYQLNCFIYALNFILRFEFFTNNAQIIDFMAKMTARHRERASKIKK